MNYFGTELTSAGHFMWEMIGSELYRNRMSIGDCPFNPEALPYKKYKNGDVGYYQCFGFSILAICGSCKDNRAGSKSVFWLEGNFTADEMKERILTIPIGKKIIEQMSFKVQW
jgi:hypothetical protein